jgi:serine protease AprX
MLKYLKNFIHRKSVLLIIVSYALLLNGAKPVDVQKKWDPGYSPPQIPKISERLQSQMLSRPPGTEKIWIFFTDKGVISPDLLTRSLKEVRQTFRKHCLWRRLKVRREANLADHDDLPLFTPYTEEVESKVNKVRTASRWLNALSAEATFPQIMQLAKLNFVRKIDLVLTFHRNEPHFPLDTDSGKKESSSTKLNYGNSFLQLNQINVVPLHQLGYSGRNVLVCMLDTGFRKSHEIFKHAHLVAEWDFVNGDNNVEQDLSDPKDYSDSHGTGTWSALGGYKSGELIGPAYNADFILAKTETTRFERQIEEDYWVAGIEWAESLGAEVVSSSLGYIDWYNFKDMDGQTAVTTKAANRAVELGVVVVTAVGNERDNLWGHIIAPSDGFDVIAVGAVDSSGNIAFFSSPGPSYDGRVKPEVCALGVDDWIAGNREDGSDIYETGSGTSFATPLVAGAAALLLEIHRDWTPLQVRSALMSTASRSLNPDNDYGWGIVNAALAASLDFALPKLEGFTIDDDSLGDSFGNGNGLVEAGETLELTLSLKNEGKVTAASLEGVLTSTHPYFEILKSRVTFPSIPPFESHASEKPFVFRIPSYFLGHHAIFRIVVQGPNSITLEDSLRISISRN